MHQTMLRYVVLKCCNNNAPINVKPLAGGRPGIGGGFDVTSLLIVGTFDHSLSSFDQQ